MKAFDRENSVWARFSEEQRLEMEEYSKKYRQFLDTARTERLANAEIIRQAEAAGFRPLSDYTSLKAGDKIYWLSTGAYTSTYASVAFNGFPPIKTYFM